MSMHPEGAIRTPIVALTLALAAGPAAGLQPDLTATLAAARELIDAGDYRRAIDSLAPLADELPAAGSALLGRALALDRRYLAAEGPLRRAVDNGSGDLATLFFLGSTLWENGKLDEAEVVFVTALEVSGGHPAIHQQLGRLELWRGHWVAAEAHFERALAKAPGDLDSTLDRARALEGAGRRSEALAAYREVVARAPEHSGARYGLARLLIETKEDEEGRRQLETYRRLVREESDATRAAGLERAALDRGLALVERGEHPAAVEHLSGLAPTPDVLDALARALEAAGRREESLRALERAVALAPDRRDLRDRLTESRLAEPRTDG